jgi:hypothetical protein
MEWTQEDILKEGEILLHQGCSPHYLHHSLLSVSVSLGLSCRLSLYLSLSPPSPLDRKYKAVDGSNRTRIRYTVSGPRGKATVYAEVSDQMQSHEFVYLITKDMKSGRVFTVIENRSPADMANPSSPPPPQPTLLDMLNRK